MTQGISDRLGPRLKAAREAAGVNRETAAAVIGVGVNELACIEDGTRDVREGTLWALATLYGLTPADVWTFDAGEDLLTRVQRKVDELEAMVETLWAAGHSYLAMVLAHALDVINHDISGERARPRRETAPVQAASVGAASEQDEG